MSTPPLRLALIHRRVNAEGVWLWSEVRDWLAAMGKAVYSYRYPTRRDHAEISSWLAGRGRR